MYYLLFAISLVPLNVFANEVKRSWNSKNEGVLQILTKSSSNITLPCNGKKSESNISIYWEKPGVTKEREIVLDDGSLFIPNLTRDDSRTYICRSVQDDSVLSKILLEVRGPPDPLENVDITPRLRNVLVSWDSPPSSFVENGNEPDSFQISTEYPDATLVKNNKNNSTFSDDSKQHSNLPLIPNTPEAYQNTLVDSSSVFVSIKYRTLNPISDWRLFSDSIPRKQKFTRLFELKSNQTYQFEIWTHNAYGRSASIYRTATTEDISSYSLPDFSHLDIRSVLVIVVTLLFILNFLGGCLLLFVSCKNRRIKILNDENCEQIELIPNITENPVSDCDDESLEHLEAGFLEFKTSAADERFSSLEVSADRIRKSSEDRPNVYSSGLDNDSTVNLLYAFRNRNTISVFPNQTTLTDNKKCINNKIEKFKHIGKPNFV